MLKRASQIVSRSFGSQIIRPAKIITSALTSIRGNYTPHDYTLPLLGIRTLSSSVNGIPTGTSTSSNRIMVKVGGTYTHWKGADLLSEDAIGITTAVSSTKAFERKLKEVDLSECKVYVMKKVSYNHDIPSEADEANTNNWVEVGSYMLQQIFDKESINPATCDVFLKIEIPESATEDNIRSVHVEPSIINPSDLVAFREAVLETNPIGNLITFKKGVEWPQLGEASLIIRDFYDDCIEGPLQSFTSDINAEYRKFIILGNPGIGKSSFGSYLMYRAIRMGRTVVYYCGKNDDLTRLTIFYKDGRIEAKKDYSVSDRSLMRDPSVVYIVDSAEPLRFVKAFTVLLTSPKRDRWWEFKKVPKSDILCFPVFSWDEILQMQKQCFPNIDEEGVRERYIKWGGIPRYVLADIGSGGQDAAASAFTLPDYSILATQLDKDGLEAQSSGSHRLLHIKNHGELSNGSIDKKDTAWHDPIKFVRW